MKCDICKKEKEFCTTECPDCYLKGCQIELDKQKNEFKEFMEQFDLGFNKDCFTISKVTFNREILEEGEE